MGRNRLLPVSEFIFHQIHLLARNWSIRVTWLNTLHLKMGHIRVDFPSFQICECCEKYLKDNKHNSLHLAWKKFQIFGLGHYLFLEAQFSESVRFSEQIMSADKYLATSSSQLKAMVYISPSLWNVDEVTHTSLSASCSLRESDSEATLPSSFSFARLTRLISSSFSAPLRSRWVCSISICLSLSRIVASRLEMVLDELECSALTENSWALMLEMEESFSCKSLSRHSH